MRDNDATRSQHILDHPQAEGEAEIKPHRVGNNFSGKAVAAVEWITVCHAPSSHIEIPSSVTFTMPIGGALLCPNALRLLRIR
jgi:hypothetical protein